MVDGDLAIAGDTFDIVRRVVGPLDNNVYLIVDRDTSKSVIIDAADDADAILLLAEDTRVQSVITTHGHWDHLQAARLVTTDLSIPFRLHPADADIAEMQPDEPLVDGDITLGNTSMRIVHSPGHTPGSVCIALNGTVLTGDTLFPGGPGATRFPYSSFSSIIESLTNHLFMLPDTTVVLPGHGNSTTIGTERPHLPAWVERGW